jgi:hypothetical protein
MDGYVSTAGYISGGTQAQPERGAQRTTSRQGPLPPRMPKVEFGTPIRRGPFIARTLADVGRLP